MAKRYHPPCPDCGSNMWRLHKSPVVKCPDCGCRLHVSNPRLRLQRNSGLARLRKELIEKSLGEGVLSPLLYVRKVGAEA